MHFFLDTEFTDLDEPNLLSIGVVSTDGSEFYAELELDTDDARDRTRVTSEFVRHGPVLAQWGRVQGAACGHQEMGRRSAAWLLQIADSNEVVVVSDCQLDFELLVGALRHAGQVDAVGAKNLVWSVPEAGPSADARRRSFKDVSRERGLLQHHALADAIALRAAWVTADGSSQKA